MTIKTTLETTTEYIKEKYYEIEVNGKKVTLKKWWKESEHGGYDNDYETEGVELLSEEEQDELSDYINELN